MGPSGTDVDSDIGKLERETPVECEGQRSFSYSAEGLGEESCLAAMHMKKVLGKGELPSWRWEMRNGPHRGWNSPRRGGDMRRKEKVVELGGHHPEIEGGDELVASEWVVGTEAGGTCLGPPALGGGCIPAGVASCSCVLCWVFPMSQVRWTITWLQR